MNADLLLAHFERIADAPDAVARLRRFILDLAVRGKLVPQVPKDEPASELLKRIAAEKARLVKAGATKADKPLLPVDGDADFDLPPNWQWTRLGIVTSYIQRGKSPKYTASDGALVVSQRCVQWAGLDLTVAKQVTLESLSDYETTRFLRDGDLLWNSTGTGTIGRVIRLVQPPKKLVCDSHVTVVRCLEVDPEYVRIWLRSDHVYGCVEERAAGSTNQVELTAQMAINQIVPLPPLAEQHRIVGKVDELMALCDQLDKARAEREATRNRLAAASLARLNAPNPETFQSDARFALDALPALTTRPDQIKQLRQIILNLAVRGQLVPQDPNDEPASELLKRIGKEKARLVKAGDSKKEKPLDPITIENQPFDLPPNWSWVRLDSLSRLITKGSSPKWQGVNYVNADEGILFITSENVGNQELRKLDDLKFVESRFRDIEPRSMLRRGDILMNLVGASIGRTAIYDLDLEANINQAVALVRLVEVSDGLLVRYLLQYFNSPTAIDFMLGSRVITAQPNMSLTDAREFPIPLPPLAEQHRIVAKVDELMSLCDRLEAGLTKSGEARSRLLGALLHEALGPA